MQTDVPELKYKDALGGGRFFKTHRCETKSFTSSIPSAEEEEEEEEDVKEEETRRRQRNDDEKKSHQ